MCNMVEGREPSGSRSTGTRRSPETMSNQHEFYLARAAEARSDAAKATLANVRERCLRAEAAWTTMADRAARNEIARETQARDKAAAKVEGAS